MKLAQLKALVKRGESERLEFKKSTAGLASGMHTICAFLNSEQGGVVIVGVTDDGKIIGQQVTDKTLKDISAELNRIEPNPHIKVLYIKVAEAKHVIVFNVDPGEKAPYTYDGRGYVRQQSTTRLMTKDEYIYLHNKNNPSQWEGLTTDRKLSDLDHHRIREVVRVAVNKGRLVETAMTAKVADILKKFGLLVDGKLTNAAVVLFAKSEEKVFMQSNIRLARFAGTDKSRFLNMKDYRANAFDLFDRAMDFFHANLPVAAYIAPGKIERIEEPAIPYSALREAIANALVHRDYSNKGSSIAIAIYDDRVNITNIGSLPKGVTLKELSKEHPSIQRNPIIANIFYLCAKIEKWGRGTLDMIRDCKNAGNPPPIFDEVGGSFSITFPFREPIRTVIYKEPSETALTQRQESILEILKNGPLKTAQIKAELSEVVTDRVLQLELAKLKKMGFVKSKGKTKTNLWYLG